MEHLVAPVQGIYLFATGIWPLLNMNTFLKVTGPKTDLWLVRIVGLLLAVIEFIYVTRRVISPIYLADAIAELILIGWWVFDIVFS